MNRGRHNAASLDEAGCREICLSWCLMLGDLHVELRKCGRFRPLQPACFSVWAGPTDVELLTPIWKAVGSTGEKYNIKVSC
jgi:hypothetical protein